MYWMLCMTFFSAYDVFQAWREQSKLLKQFLNYISGNEYFKNVIDGKVYMKLSVMAREKNYLMANTIGSPFWSLNCVQTSVGVPFCHWLSF